MDRAVVDRVKRATVALAVVDTQSSPPPWDDAPYKIIGTGFCIHEGGAIVTCRYVVDGFMPTPMMDQIEQAPDGGPLPEQSLDAIRRRRRSQVGRVTRPD